MAKASGLGDNFYIQGVDLSGDVGALDTISGSMETLEVTGINKSAMERIGGLRDGNIEFKSFFNAASGASHETLSALPRTDVHTMYTRGTSLGDAAACMIGKQANYDGTREDDGAFTFDIQVQANGYGLEWGELYTDGKVTHASADSESSVDNGAAGTNGLQAYLQVFSLGSGTATVKLQESSDDDDADDWADITGGGFTAVTAAGAQRIAVSGNIEQYIRVTTTGTFTDLVFAVVVVRNEVAVTF